MSKGGKREGAGRPKGSKSRASEAVRAQFELFLRSASEDIHELFRAVKEENPKQALDAIRDYAEFVLPKLQRVESDVSNRYVDEDGKDLHKTDRELLKKMGIDV